MSTIKVSCTDQVLAITDSPVLASGGVNENFIEFDFCEQWAGFGKTCVFFRERGEYSYSILDGSDKCVIPPEATAGAGRMYFGVIGVNEAGTVRTTELLGYRIVAGAVTEVPAPTPELYQQILGQLTGLREDVADAEENMSTLANQAAQTAAASATATATAAAQQAETAAGSADQSAKDSEAWAIGKRDGVEVPTDDQTYHNNAKYWASQAAQAAGGGVMSFNGRTGTVEPMAGDYTAGQVGALPNTDGAVGTANIGDGVVTAQKIAAGAVQTTHIGANVITRAKMAIDAFTLADNAGAHNAIYRGKNLGSAVTAAQWAAIEAGTFDDLFIGDYWEINDVIWRIAAFDYYYNTGDVACTTHHVVIVPDTALYEAAMNSSQSTATGYVGSTMYTSGLNQAKTMINSAFGESHILSHRQFLCNAVTNGRPSGYGIYDSTVELMTEQNVYGGGIYTEGNTGSSLPTLMTIDTSQFPLFAHDHSKIVVPDKWVGLRDIVSATSYARVTSRGAADWTANITNPIAVRPAFSIKA